MNALLLLVIHRLNFPALFLAILKDLLNTTSNAIKMMDVGYVPDASLFVPRGSFIVCDQAYSLRSYQISPFSSLEANNERIEFFNDRLRKARRIIERVFGMIKKRWRLLDRPCQNSVSTKTGYTWAAIILHNIILRSESDMGELPEAEELQQQDEPELTLELDDALSRGQLRRTELVEELWAEFHT